MLDIQEVKALFFNDNALIEPNIRLRRIDGGDFRFYFEINDDLDSSIDFYNGWTGLIDKVVPKNEFLIKWIADKGYENSNEYKNERAEYGTCMHILIAHYLLKKEFILEKNYILKLISEANLTLKYFKQSWIEDLQKNIVAFANFANSVELVPLAIEIPLASKRFGCAGTIDLVAKMNFNKKRVTAIIDFKSGKNPYESAEIQLKAYEMTWNENFPDDKIDMLFNWNPKDFRTENATYLLTDQTGKHSDRKIEILVELYKMDNPVKPGPRMDISGTIKFGREIKNVKIVDIEDYIKNKHNIPSKTYLTPEGTIEEIEDNGDPLGEIKPIQTVSTNEFLEF